MAAFTAEERARIRHHLGYPNVNANPTIALGFPAMTQSSFLVEQGMDHLLEAAAGPVRQYVAVLDEVEARLMGVADRFVATRVGEISLNPMEPDQLEREYLRWAYRLAEDLGVPINALSRRFATDGGKVPINGRRIY
jgi:hypothetical protein